MTHKLKIWPEFFEAILDGTKRFEIRKDDRGFAVGDILHLEEWNPESKSYTGRWCKVEVTYKAGSSRHNPFSESLQRGYCVMAIRWVEEP